MTETLWRQVPGFEKYLVSNDGQVRGPFGPRKPYVGPTGYHRFDAWNSAEQRMQKISVHRAVLLAFVGPCPEGQQVRHLNGDPGDNRLENLVYGTPQQNSADRIRHETQTRGERVNKAKLTAADVAAIRSSREPTAALAVRFRVTEVQINSIRSGRSWRHLPGGDRKGALHGTEHPFAKLTEADVRAIRSNTTASQSQLARAYRVNSATISDIVRRKTWKHVA